MPHLESIKTNISVRTPGIIRFNGSPSAELFTKELEESVRGALEHNLSTEETSDFPKGFAVASLPGHPWDDTCWSRDAGVFLREAALWGYFNEAVLVAGHLLSHVEANPVGYYTYPMFFKHHEKNWGYEMDGTAAVVIGMARLWQRLDNGIAIKEKLYEFLAGERSPAAFILKRLKDEPLIGGSGEFGGGWGVEGNWYNVVQNGMLRQALLACAEVEDECGHDAKAQALRDGASALFGNILKHLVDEKDGSWLWCIDPHTLLPDEAALNHPLTSAAASVNGAGSCYADAEGLEPVAASWPGVAASKATLARVYNGSRTRREQHQKYGMCTFVDSEDTGWLPGWASWLSYCDCYAAEAMLLLDRTDLLDPTMNWIAAATYMGGSPSAGFIAKLALGEAEVDFTRPACDFWFTERNFSPDFKGERDIGCGKLNLINVAEPMKLARMMLGVDDRYSGEVYIVPRLPDSWTGLEAGNWPVKTARGVVRVDIAFEKKPGNKFTFRLTAVEGKAIHRLTVRFPGGARKTYEEASEILETV